jgi:predicted phage terminase large subunit-like protein
MIEIRPQPGFQTKVLACKADIAITGGSAGCGKTWANIIEALRYVHLPDSKVGLIRKTYPELVGPGSIWEEMHGIYPHFGARPRAGKYLDWTFPSGATVTCSHMQYDSDRIKYQGKQYTTILWEEVAHATAAQFWWVWSRLRTLSEIKPYLRANCNPDPNSFVADLIEWWIDQDTGYPIKERSGVLRYFVRLDDTLHWGDCPDKLKDEYGIPATSFTFIPGQLEENQILLRANPEYQTYLMGLPMVERERLLKGNWLITHKKGNIFRPDYFEITDDIDLDQIKTCVRFWDKAATEKTSSHDPSWTVGVKMARLKDGRYAILDIVRLRGTPNKVDHAMWTTATQDGDSVNIGVFQDPGQAGIVDLTHTKKTLIPYRVTGYKVTKSKIHMASPVSAIAESGKLLLQKGQWNRAYIAELSDFPDGKHDDQVDATSGAYQQLQKPGLSYLAA